MRRLQVFFALQVVATSGQYCCKWPLQVVKKLQVVAASCKKLQVIDIAASVLIFGGPYKLARCKLICCKCPYTASPGPVSLKLKDC